MRSPARSLLYGGSWRVRRWIFVIACAAAVSWVPFWLIIYENNSLRSDVQQTNSKPSVSGVKMKPHSKTHDQGQLQQQKDQLLAQEINTNTENRRGVASPNREDQDVALNGNDCYWFVENKLKNLCALYDRSTKRKALVVQTMFYDLKNGAKRGGPSGELHQFNTLLRALKILNFDTKMANTDDEAVQSLKDPLYDLVITDRFSYPILIRTGHMAAHFAKYRFLDFWGAPADDTMAPFPSMKLPFQPEPHQFLVPYEIPPNSFVPYHADITNDPMLRSGGIRKEIPWNKRVGGLVWGKEGSYFSGRLQLLHKISELVPLHTTLEKARMKGVRLSDSIINHGAVDENEWMKLLGSVRFIVGLGDPLAGPTVFEALSMGCIFINPVFQPPRSIPHNRAVVWTSQHPWAQAIGPPYVHTIDLDNHTAVINLISEISRLESAPPSWENRNHSFPAAVQHLYSHLLETGILS